MSKLAVGVRVKIIDFKLEGKSGHMHAGKTGVIVLDERGDEHYPWDYSVHFDCGQKYVPFYACELEVIDEQA